MIFIFLFLAFQINFKNISEFLASPNQKDRFKSAPLQQNKVHSVPQRSSFLIKKNQPSLQIPKNKNWNGHFSVVNFKTNEKQKLASIKNSLDKALALLPKNHTKALKYLEIKNEKNKSRGMANAKKMIIYTGTIDSDQELKAIFIHEMGHVVDIGVVQGYNQIPSMFTNGNTPIYTDDISLKFYKISWKNSITRKNDAQRSDFVSGYAMTNAFEDFAESYLFYRLHGEKFRYSMKYSPQLRKKYDYLKTEIFYGQEFQINKKVKNFVPDVIWDATLLTYEE